jgi:hypothetical protein
MRIVMLVLTLGLLPTAALAVDGALDPGFGNGGIVEIA